jgi:hypothetical protein
MSARGDVYESAERRVSVRRVHPDVRIVSEAPRQFARIQATASLPLTV